MSFPRYPAYKDSGVEWLGEVPVGWEVLPIKRMFRIVGGSTPKSDSESFWTGDILWATPTDLSRRECVYIADTERKISEAGLESCAASIVPRGSIILSTRAPIGSLAIADAEMCTNQGCKSLVTSTDAHPVYFAHLLSISTAELNIRGKGTTFLELSADALGAFATPVPPLPEQLAIAAFLDRETAKIDALVAEQQRLIALLKEKRQAVISHAVTKGLNPDAPTKDSGVEWLGEVPAHWEVMPVRKVARLESGHTPSRNHPEYWENCVVPWFSLADVWQIREEGRSVIYETNEKVSEMGLANSSARRLPPGTVMLSRTASVGFAAIMGVEMATTQDFANWVCGDRLKPEFLLSVFRSMRGEFRRLMMGSTHNTIYMPDIQSLCFSLPPLPEQTAITVFLDAETTRLDALTATAERAIELLQERRTALISAAVTGQIDVREVTA